MEYQNIGQARQGGFSLIEIMVVIIIIGILAGTVAINLMDEPDKAKIVAVKNDLRTIENALKLYRLHSGKYPTTEQGLQALTQSSGQSSASKTSAYLKKVPLDPWRKEYQYLSPGVHGELDIFSYGRDKQPGGEGMDADIGNWDLE